MLSLLAIRPTAARAPAVRLTTGPAPRPRASAPFDRATDQVDPRELTWACRPSGPSSPLLPVFIGQVTSRRHLGVRSAQGRPTPSCAARGTGSSSRSRLRFFKVARRWRTRATCSSASAGEHLESVAKHAIDAILAGRVEARSTTSRQRPRRRFLRGSDSDAAARSGTSRRRTLWRRSGPRRRRRAGRRRRPACASCPTAGGTSPAATSSYFLIRSVETTATGARRVSCRAGCPGSGSPPSGRASGRPSVPAPARWRAVGSLSPWSKG